MGTRHHQTVIDKEGNLKLSQYGQWDGYPSGQGVDILKYLKSGNLTKYQEEISRLREVTEEELKGIDKQHGKKWDQIYPYLSRNCGAKIHQMIENGEVKFVALMDKKEADQWCRGFYTIDFQKNTFSSYFDGNETSYPLDNLPTEDRYLSDMKYSES